MRPLSKLKNIGKTIEARLNEIGVFTEADLLQIGAAKAFKQIKENYPDKTIPICYYLYSFEGAILDLHWNDIPERRKKELLKGIGK